MPSRLTDIAVELVHETELAILVSDGDQEVWIPKSQCEFEAHNKPLPYATIVTLSERAAIDKGLV